MTCGPDEGGEGVFDGWEVAGVSASERVNLTGLVSGEGVRGDAIVAGCSEGQSGEHGDSEVASDE